MKRILTPFLALLCLVTVAAPANAYCVVNDTTRHLYVALESYGSLGNFEKVIAPKRKVCCDWFDRRCNPKGTRENLVPLSVQGLTHEIKQDPKRKKKKPNDSALTRKLDEILGRTRDSYGNKTSSGTRRNRLARRKNGLLRPKNELPEPRTGRSDAAATRGYILGPLIIDSKKPYYCSTGSQRITFASGAGTVTVREDTLSRGKLRCESRDHFLRPVNGFAAGLNNGIPLLNVPRVTPYSSERRPRIIQPKSK